MKHIAWIDVNHVSNDDFIALCKKYNYSYTLKRHFLVMFEKKFDKFLRELKHIHQVGYSHAISTGITTAKFEIIRTDTDLKMAKLIRELRFMEDISAEDIKFIDCLNEITELNNLTDMFQNNL